MVVYHSYSCNKNSFHKLSKIFFLYIPKILDRYQNILLLFYSTIHNKQVFVVFAFFFSYIFSQTIYNRQGWTRTNGVSYVANLQSAAFATRLPTVNYLFAPFHKCTAKILCKSTLLQQCLSPTIYRLRKLHYKQFFYL